MVSKRKLSIGLAVFSAALAVLGVSIFYPAMSKYFRGRQSLPTGVACLAGMNPADYSCGPFGPALVEACQKAKDPQCRRAAWSRALLLSLTRQIPDSQSSCLQPGEEPWLWACGPFDASLVEVCRSRLKAGDICSTNRWHRELLGRALSAAFSAPLRTERRPILIVKAEGEKWTLLLQSDLKVLGQIPVELSSDAMPGEGVWWVQTRDSATNGLRWNDGIGSLTPTGARAAVELLLAQRTVKGLERTFEVAVGAGLAGIKVLDGEAQRSFVSWFSDPGSAPRALWMSRKGGRTPSPAEQRSMREPPVTLKTSK